MFPDQWFVSINGKELGPYRLQHLMELRAQGKLPPDAPIRQSGESWLRQDQPSETFSAPSFGNAATAQSPEAAGFPLSSLGSGDSTRSRNYFVRHWRGQLPLPISYWVNVLGINFAFVLLASAIKAQPAPDADFNPWTAPLLMIAVWLFVLPLAVWQIAGAWRASRSYSATHPRRSWGGITRFFLVLGVIGTLVDIIKHDIPLLTELVQIAAGDTKYGSYSFRVLRDGQELEFSGGISYGAAAELERMIETMDALKTVHLNSIGGRIAEASRMGAIIRRRSLDTYVAKSCLSACTIVFLNGKERFITSESRIGFHQPHSPGLDAEERREIIQQEEARLRSLGLSAAFARKANLAAPNDMWFPTTSELLKERVATGLVSANDYALSGLPQNFRKDKVQEALDSIPAFQAIRKIDPEEYQKLTAGIQTALERGKSLPEIHAELSPIPIKVLSQILPYASDEHLLQFSKLLVRVSRTYNEDDPSVCYSYTNTNKSAQDSAKVLAMRAKYKSLANEEDQLQLLILNSYTGKERAIPTEAEVNPILVRVFTELAKQGVDFSLFEAEGPIPPDKHYKYCDGLIRLFEQTSKLPAKDASSLLRFLLIAGTRG